MIRLFDFSGFKQLVDNIKAKIDAKLKLWSENRHMIFKSKDINVGDGSSYRNKYKYKYGSTKIVNKNKYNRSNCNMNNLDSHDELQLRVKYHSLEKKGFENLTEEEKCLFLSLEEMLFNR